MSFAISIGVQATVAQEVTQQAAQGGSAQPQNSIFDSDEARETAINSVMEHTNTARDVAETVVNNADTYAAQTLAGAADANKGLTIDEWATDSRANYVGTDKDGIRDIFNSMDLDGDGHLDGQELFAAQLYKDVTSDAKDGNVADQKGNYVIDGKMNTQEEANGMASNMKGLTSSEGKAILQDMFAISFGDAASAIKTATGVYRNNLRSAAHDETFARVDAERREELIQSWGDIYAEQLSDIYAKYSSEDGFLYQDNWEQMLTDYEQAEDARYVNTSEANAALSYMSVDTNGDGRLSFSEISAYAGYTGNAYDLTNVLDIAARRTGVNFNSENTLTDYYNRAVEGTDNTFFTLINQLRGEYARVAASQGFADDATYSTEGYGGFTKDEWYAAAGQAA